MQALEQERDQVLAEHVTLRNALGQYREQAARDPLTGLMNRRAFIDAARSALGDAVENGTPVTAMFLDVDNFKPINDDYGHHVGDEVLRRVAVVIDAAGRGGLAGRYGGEEFVVLVAGLDEIEAAERAETLLADLRTIDLSTVAAHRCVTASLGVVWCRTVGDRTVPSLVAQADELMYAAKRGGKDRCCFAVEDGDEPACPAHDAGREKPLAG
jgi:diguanylate cyclase (GGDEF)-like protein